MVEILQNKENTEKIEFVASENGTILGRCAGYPMGETFVLDELECEEFFTDGLVRAILNLADLHGMMNFRFDLSEKSDIDRLQKLGFVYNAEKTIYGIADFFSENKNCTKK